jgi:hypothetical protein
MTIPINIPTPAQIAAAGAAFQRLGHAAQQAASGMAEAVAAAAQRLSLKRKDRAPSIVPFGPTIGRKRRARRARGRRIKARRNPPYIGGRVWLARQTFARVRAGGAPLPRVIMLDEIDSFPTGGLTIEQWAAAHRTMQGQQGEKQADV